MKVRRISTRQIRAMKERGEPIATVTAYDAVMGRLAEEAGLPLVLVGDSLGQVVLGHESTIPVTMDDMVRATAAVLRGTSRALVVADMPFMSYQVDAATTLRNAGRLIQEGGAQAVKLEGGRSVAPMISRLTEAGIAVMGHIGFVPQSVHQLGGYRVQGRDQDAAAALIEDALAVQTAGAFSIVLELLPVEVAAEITRRLRIPTIGIGAGPHCDGQIQVLHDLLGLLPDFRPRHARRYAELADTVRAALERYAEDVRSGAFPAADESFFADEPAPAGGRTGDGGESGPPESG